MKAVNLGGVGSDRKPAGIAKLVAPKVIEHWAAERTCVIVCFDRESRERCAPDLASDVTHALIAEISAKTKLKGSVSVVIADRAFEAWLLADAEGLSARGVFTSNPTFHSFEGSPGAGAKKGVVELTSLLGRQYSKTTDGPRLFEQLDFPTARRFANGGRGSRSLDKFLRCLGV